MVANRQGLKPTNFVCLGIYLQQKKIHGQKQKNHELTETEMIFKNNYFFQYLQQKKKLTKKSSLYHFFPIFILYTVLGISNYKYLMFDFVRK
jgi:hypothetical protein